MASTAVIAGSAPHTGKRFLCAAGSHAPMLVTVSLSQVPCDVVCALRTVCEAHSYGTPMVWCSRIANQKKQGCLVALPTSNDSFLVHSSGTSGSFIAMHAATAGATHGFHAQHYCTRSSPSMCQPPLMNH